MAGTMTKDEAQKWARQVAHKGTGAVRQAYLKKFGAGEVAEKYWNAALFTLGIEYGILIAVAKVYGDLEG